MRRLAAAAVAVLALAAPAVASDRLDVDATDVKLAVSRDGRTALVTYRAAGHLRHALVWGAVNALPPSPTVAQVRFKIDWSGGWASRKELVWKTFGNATTCRSPAARHGRPATGARTGSTCSAPGVTPNLLAEVRDPGDYDANDPAKVAYERQMNERLLQLAAGDKYCPSQL